ncbi:MAG: UDP-2,3-diacylglucosamine diphosphatase LpxI [Fusobacterium sp.]|uniref:LpxI family protein n=1 Tax=Fusobacterium sp. TaxID=68766 RepID=UPI0026DB05AA|nr:UDP-2,3-diacylglucosamine diphosphatase LpxI [Fusobacterium sp.]MDO4689781.1 UDP-2,3-diacylglucosamine diphosphatase LpxI [Fusobacterium sp.]
MDKIGLIVGNGDFPFYFIEEAKRNNILIYPIGLFPTINVNIKKIENYVEFNIGNIGEIVKYLLKNDIKKIVMLGKVEKKLIFEDLILDKYGERIMEIVPDKKDETLLFAIIGFLRLNKIKVLPQSYLMKKFLFEDRCYTDVIPNKEDQKTIKIGIEAAKALSRVDAGQTVVCRDMSVIAIEGIEGTDETIKRAGLYSNKNNIIVKMSRPQQDMRVDIPTIGINTLKIAYENNAKGIVAEAKKMMFLDQEECIKFANEKGLFIVGKKI